MSAQEDVTARIVRDDPVGCAEAVSVLRDGGIVALPTDTVYGIAADLRVEGSIERLFHVKQRPADKGVMLLLADSAQAADAGEMSPSATVASAAFWPGGLTVVVPQLADRRLPEALTGGAKTIGLRVPNHPTPRAIASVVGPLPTTSANISGQPEAATAEQIAAQLGEVIELILDGGPAPGGPASTVVDCSGDRARILRVGAIAVADIAAVLEAAGLELDPSLPAGSR